MWLGNKSNISDYIKYLWKRKGIKIGFYTGNSDGLSWLKPYFSEYNNIVASTRLRVNDIIYYSLNNPLLNMRFYDPLKNYDIIVFQKTFSKDAYNIALNAKKRSTKIVLDVNVNYFDKSSEYINRFQYENIKRFTKIVDYVIATTNNLKNYILENNFHKKAIVIPEIISDSFFSVKKEHKHKKTITILYVGYAVKADALEIIKDELELLNNRYDLKLLTICEKKPEINIKIDKEFIRYDQARLPHDIIKGDIFLAPRDLSDPYNLYHSFTKIGYPMACGLPVLASPIPSYLNSPAVICRNTSEWLKEIESLIEDVEKRQILSKAGINYCIKFFTKNKIMPIYSSFFSRLFNS